jgi:dynein heavy chain
LEDFWKNHKLVVQKVKGTKDQYLITNLMQLEEQLDENVLIINNILG